ncbi:MAG TPA: ARMT1-like domain-containing protein [Syntrophorhabdaceae bacterium]|jgi:hypothetical protein
MDVTARCYGCLRGLVEKTVSLSGGDGAAFSSTIGLLDRLYAAHATPPAIANRLLAHIKERTGCYDPFEPIKKIELERARSARVRLESRFEPTLLGALTSSALGNSTDFFVEGAFDPDDFRFYIDLDKIEEEIYTKKGMALILGDNVGDFFFDIPLIRFLEGLGRHVFYAVREHPVQNDLSMKEVASYQLGEMHGNIISTGTAEVGITREQITGAVKNLWEADGVVIAKGMGNYETISQFDPGRTIIHIMKIKCEAVAEDVGRPVGSYITISLGEENGG